MVVERRRPARCRGRAGCSCVRWLAAARKTSGAEEWRVLLEEVVLDLPDVLEAELVGELDLLERVLKAGARRPRPRAAEAGARRTCRSAWGSFHGSLVVQIDRYRLISQDLAWRKRPGSPSARERGRQARHDRILEAASRLFADAGFAKTSVDEVASAAGVSKGLVYDHYDSKEELLAAVFWRLVEQWDAETLRTRLRRGDIPASLGRVIARRSARSAATSFSSAS